VKLSKHSRTKIRQSAEPVEIQWPVAAGEPQVGQKYRVGLDLTVLVVARRETPKRWKATVKSDDDPVRGLRSSARKRPEADPMGGPQFRTETEPEQVSRAYQRLIAEEGRLKTALAGGEQRMKAKVLAEEQRALDARRKRRKGTLHFIERVERHRELKDAA
jgi:hypothetical protein